MSRPDDSNGHRQRVKTVAMTSLLFGALIEADEWEHDRWLALAVFVAWQVLCLFADAVVLKGRSQRTQSAAYFVINTAAVIALGVVAEWSVPAMLMLPYTIAAYEMFNEGDRRPFVVAQLCIVAAAMFICRVSWESVAAVTALAGIIHWQSSVRLKTVRAALADLAETNASLAEEMQARLQAEAELRQAHKLESVGRLAAGVAHEINTPVQFVRDSVQFLSESTQTLTYAVAAYRHAAPSTPQLARLAEEADLDYLLEEMPAAVERSREGLQRIAVIVRSMKDFAHPEQREMQPFDLNRGISSTLVIATSELKMVADVKTDLAELPMLFGHGGELNQVVLNIVTNAAHAIGDRLGKSPGRGHITVRSRVEGPHVVVSIADDGGGIPAAIRDRIFEPFFTTKEVGRGTGQGLAISRSVVAKHGGTLTFETRIGEGTTFFIHLPLPSTATTREAA